MEKTIIYGIQVLIFIILLWLIIRKWVKSYYDKQQLDDTNIAFGIFLANQILSLGFIMLLGTHEQSFSYLADLKLFDDDSKDFWLYIGALSLLVLLVYFVSTLLAFFFHKSILPSINQVKEDIYSNNWTSIMNFCLVQLVLSAVLSYFVMNPILYDLALSFKKFGTNFF